MKKLLYNTTIILMFLAVSGCGDGDTVGLGGGEKIPENNLKGTAWEYKRYESYYDPYNFGNIIYTDEIFQSSYISFTEKEFTFKRYLNYTYDHTFTGTYSLFYHKITESVQWEAIQFISDELSINGTAMYTTSVYGYTTPVIMFTALTGTPPVAGIMHKIID